MRIQEFIFSVVMALGIGATAAADGFPDNAIGTYVGLARNGASSGEYFQLSDADNEWVVQQKSEHSAWNPIECLTSCTYRKVIESELIAIFPYEWRSRAKFECIQNSVLAFCEYTINDDEALREFVIVRWDTGRPLPTMLEHINTPAAQ